MKTYNITPKNHRSTKRSKDEVELIKLDMTEDDLKFTSVEKDVYIRVNINFPSHCMTRVLGLN